MRHETILRRLKEALREKDLLKAYKKFQLLTDELEAYIQRQQEAKARYTKLVQHLMGWYKTAWNGKPPEALSRTNWEDVVAKTLRELVLIYEQNKLSVEELKREYEEFKNREKRWLAGDRSITRFRQVLPQLKQSQTQKKWTSPETERGLDYYFGDGDIEW